MALQHVAIALEGLSCGGGGVLMIERELKKVPGVEHVYANPATEMAYLEYDPKRATSAQLIKAVERAGFRAGEISER
jgi:copper chaperone CopZ